MEQDAPKRKIDRCQVCGESDFSLYLETRDYFLTQETFLLDKCNSCGFVFTNPVPVEEELSRYYDSPDYLSHETSSNNFTSLIYNILRNFNIRLKFSNINKFQKRGSILDIGCGTGELLHYFKNKGWEVSGIEPNPKAREFAIKAYQLPVYEEEKLDSFEENSFDVISMWHVLEHVPDLNGRMEQLRRLIKKEGTIFIALPNLASPDAEKYDKLWAGLDVPRHLYHFTEDSFLKLLKKHKMSLIKSTPLKLDAYYVSLLSEKYRENKLPYFAAFFSGLQSNRKARRSNNYSSMVFAVKLQK